MNKRKSIASLRFLLQMLVQLQEQSSGIRNSTLGRESLLEVLCFAATVLLFAISVCPPLNFHPTIPSRQGWLLYPTIKGTTNLEIPFPSRSHYNLPQPSNHFCYVLGPSGVATSSYCFLPSLWLSRKLPRQLPYACPMHRF